jgi:glycosyltransferase involved in cell wall biosynthesis
MPQHMGGTEVYVHTLASLQRQGGHQASVLVPHFEYYLPGQYVECYQYEGIDVYQYLEPSDPLNRQILSGAEEPAGLENFKAFLLAFRPDVVHFHELTRSIGFGVRHVRIARSLGVKVFLTMHLSGYTCNTNTLINHNRLCSGEIREFDCSICCYKTLFHLPDAVAYPAGVISLLSARLGLTRKLPPGKLTTLLGLPLAIQRVRNELQELIANTDRLVSLTEWYKKILITNGVPPDKIMVIPQALTTGHAKTPREKDPSRRLPLKLVFIGRIQPQKGVDLLIEAVRGFTAAEVQVDLYGKEEGTDFYRQCIAALDTLDTATFRGMLRREEVLDTLAEYDMLCLPSTFSEMSPLVIQEAFAAGIPVLASKVYGNAEQVKDGQNGLLFDFKSAASLRAKISELINEPELLPRLKRNVQPPHPFTEVNAAYMQLYTQS